MRIALVVPGGVDESAELRVIPALLWLIERLARLHEVHVFALDQYPHRRDYALLGASVHNLGSFRSRGVKRFWLRLLALRSGFHEFGPFDVVHAFWAAPAGALAAFALGAARAPLIVTLAGGELAEVPAIRYGAQGAWRSRALVGLALRRAARITCATRFMARLARAKGVEPLLVPLGAARNEFGAADRSTLGGVGPPFRLLSVGSLNPVKNHPMLLKAFRRVLNQEPDSRLDIVGEDTLRGSIQQLAHELELEDKVTFHGFLRTRDLAPLYRRAHLLVHTAWHEAGPLVALEAGLTGLPCVGTAVGQVDDWHSASGLTVAPDDDAGLAPLILRLLRDPALRAELGSAAREFAWRHDADYTADAFLAMYAEVSSQLAPTR